jgi:hypothetical protein
MATATDGTELAAKAAAALLGVVAAFQVALALGAPWGEATQGGRAATTHDGVLTAGGRTLAAVSATVLVAAAAVVLARAGVVRTRIRPRVLRRATWTIAAILAVNTLGNVAGHHPFERWVMGGISVIAMTLTAIVAHGETGATSTNRASGSTS